MAKIFAPNKQYTGVVATVSFVDGVGESNDSYLIDYFKRKGYTIEEKKETPKTKTSSTRKKGSTSKVKQEK